jgi:hypothetical protein
MGDLSGSAPVRSATVDTLALPSVGTASGT